jgi:hypothetical protein
MLKDKKPGLPVEPAGGVTVNVASRTLPVVGSVFRLRTRIYRAGIDGGLDGGAPTMFWLSVLNDVEPMYSTEHASIGDPGVLVSRLNTYCCQLEFG